MTLDQVSRESKDSNGGGKSHQESGERDHVIECAWKLAWLNNDSMFSGEGASRLYIFLILYENALKLGIFHDIVASDKAAFV